MILSEPSTFFVLSFCSICCSPSSFISVAMLVWMCVSMCVVFFLLDFHLAEGHLVRC